MRWKQWLQVARAMLDSDMPDHPKSANTKAFCSAAEEGGKFSGGKDTGVKKDGFMFFRISSTDGPGCVKFSGSGSSSVMGSNERYRSRSSAELLTRSGIDMW